MILRIWSSRWATMCFGLGLLLLSAIPQAAEGQGNDTVTLLSVDVWHSGGRRPDETFRYTTNNATFTPPTLLPPDSVGSNGEERVFAHVSGNDGYNFYIHMHKPMLGTFTFRDTPWLDISNPSSPWIEAPMLTLYIMDSDGRMVGTACSSVIQSYTPYQVYNVTMQYDETDGTYSEMYEEVYERCNSGQFPNFRVRLIYKYNIPLSCDSYMCGY